MPKAPYELSMPDARTTSVIFASPHSGRVYPRAFLRASVLDERTIRSSEDMYVDRLFADAPAFGAPLLAATAPRAYIDLNRGADELDPAVVKGTPNPGRNPRVASGLGVIPRVVASGRAIYRGHVSRAEAEERIARFWRPYHDRLGRLMAESHRHFGQAILIDCHSMPHEAACGIRPRGAAVPDVVLGDRFGVSAAGAVVDRIEAAFRGAGLNVVRNAPFAGAYIVGRYGCPSAGRHAVQVEIDRSLYMDEARFRPNRNFAAFRRLISGIACELAAIGLPELRLAAE